MDKERLLTEILLDIEGHKGILETAKKEVAKARATVAFWEAHVRSHSAILRDLYKVYSDRTGEPVKEVEDEETSLGFDNHGRLTDEDKQEFMNRLKECQQSDDEEVAHIKADDVLCAALKNLGYEEIVEEWEKVDKWYA